MSEFKQALLGILAASLVGVIVFGSLIVAIVEDDRPQAEQPNQVMALGQPLITPEPVQAINAVPIQNPQQRQQAAQAIAAYEQANQQLPACPAPAGWMLYRVMAEDTPRSLAEAFGLSEEEFLSYNCLGVAVGSLPTGSTVYLPAVSPLMVDSDETGRPASERQTAGSKQPKTEKCGPPAWWVAYRVHTGDTLFALGLATGASVTEIQRGNCLGSSTLIRTGQALYLPAWPGGAAEPPTRPKVTKPPVDPTRPPVVTTLPPTGETPTEPPPDETPSPEPTLDPSETVEPTDPAVTEAPTDDPQPSEEPTLDPSETVEPTDPAVTEAPTEDPQPSQEPGGEPEPSEEPTGEPGPSQEPPQDPQPSQEPAGGPGPSQEPPQDPQPSQEPGGEPGPSQEMPGGSEPGAPAQTAESALDQAPQPAAPPEQTQAPAQAEAPAEGKAQPPAEPEQPSMGDQQQPPEQSTPEPSSTGLDDSRTRLAGAPDRFGGFFHELLQPWYHLVILLVIFLVYRFR